MQRKILKSNEEATRKLDDFKYASKEKQRFLVYSHMLNATDRVIKYETEEKLCYFLETLTPKFGVTGYIQRTTTDGFTFDKKKRKLSVWFGKSLIKMSTNFIGTMMSDVNAEWYNSMCANLRMVATRMLLEKIIKGNITGQTPYCESYVKYHLKVKGLSHLSYYAVVSNSSTHIGTLNAYLRYAENPQDLIVNYNAYTNNGILNQNILNNCKVLGLKFDWSLSLDAIKAKNKEMEIAIEKLHKEYKVVQEFYGYIKPIQPPSPITDNLPF